MNLKGTQTKVKKREENLFKKITPLIEGILISATAVLVVSTIFKLKTERKRKRDPSIEEIWTF